MFPATDALYGSLAFGYVVFCVGSVVYVVIGVREYWPLRVPEMRTRQEYMVALCTARRRWRDFASLAYGVYVGIHLVFMFVGFMVLRLSQITIAAPLPGAAFWVCPPVVLPTLIALPIYLVGYSLDRKALSRHAALSADKRQCSRDTGTQRQ